APGCAQDAEARPGKPIAQTKQLQAAVSNGEKHFGELCQILAAYVRKTARLQDKAELLMNEINS
ncbi:CBY1-interacting BAR domain-containing protein 1, partial [Saguinus oedipus]